MVKNIDKVTDRIKWGYLIAFLLLLISYVLSFYTNKKLLNEANWVNHTHMVIRDVEVLASNVTDAESGMRGYFLTSQNIFLDRYHQIMASVDSVYKDLLKLTRDNPIQQNRLATMNSLINRKFQLMNSTKHFYEDNGHKINDTLISNWQRGKGLMDSIRLVANNINVTEATLMDKRSGQVVNFSHFINVINIASLLIAILMIFYSLFAFNKEKNAKKEADLETLKYREQLEARVSDLDKLNAELVELKSLEKFALTGRISRTIAHEVRNPLTNINLAVEQLRIELSEKEDAQMLLDMIARNGTRINQLISDLLNSTRTNLLNFEKRNINDLLDESLLFAEDRIELKDVKVIKEYTDEKCVIEADSQKINIAFLNIIVNACEAMEAHKGILTIKTERRKDKCLVIISDNGKGIDADSVSRLFEPYFTTKDNGNGLGLTNTQNIILSHKGSISAESIPGEGTSFTISFSCC